MFHRGELFSEILRLQKIINQLRIHLVRYERTELVDETNGLIGEAELSPCAPTLYAKQRSVRRSFFEIVACGDSDVGRVVNVIVESNIFRGNVK